jgi:hypothetical protein
MSDAARSATSTLGAALAFGCAVASGQSGMPAVASRAPEGVASTPATTSLRMTRARRYTMSGAIRPLLFWVGRDDIGVARVVWRRGDDGARGYELLIGTDPARAPRSLNRWGYIAEDMRGAEWSMLALMTRSDESSYDEAATGATRGRAAGDFRAIRARAGDAAATWQVAAVQTPEPLTVHDLGAALDRVGNGTAWAARREMRMPSDARPGFLAALAELVDRAVAAREHAGAAQLARARLQYLFAGQIYELKLRRAERGIEPFRNESIPIVRTAFDLHTLATNARTQFEMTCGTEGALAGVPLAVSWQPRWWLKVSLTLID